MVSVLIPVYNQYRELAISLSAFEKQMVGENYEIVVVDDASSEKDMSVIDRHFRNNRGKITYIEHKSNKGRAATRNDAIDISKGDVLVFNDADRFPDQDFLNQHIRTLQNHSGAISVGRVLESYDSVEKLTDSALHSVVKRKAMYYRVIETLFDPFGMSDSALKWLATLSGNMAIRKETLARERFDEAFTEWGFEHFELGYRLLKQGCDIVLTRGAINTHIAHSRSDMNYLEQIEKSHEIFYKKHKTNDVKMMKDFLRGSISLQQYERVLHGPKQWMSGKKEMYNHIFAVRKKEE